MISWLGLAILLYAAALGVVALTRPRQPSPRELLERVDELVDEHWPARAPGRAARRVTDTTT